MLLTVGALARRSGLTVRTLHHYDEIGLVRPSARSEAGYRLYSDTDIARLHAVQALRHFGLPLAQIAATLDGDASAPATVLNQQIQALDHQIRSATELRGQLTTLRDVLLRGEAPDIRQWLDALSLMSTYGRYFNAEEIRRILAAWRAIEAEWHPLKAQVRACMDSGADPQSEPAQVLARRWMLLMHRWMGGDFTLMDRWGAMFREQPDTHGRADAPTSDMIRYMEQAVAFRQGLLNAHFGERHARQVRLMPEKDLAAIEQAGRKLMAAGRSPTSLAARRLNARWLALVDEAADGDATLRDKLLTLHQGHPLLLAGVPLGREVREYLSKAPAPGA